MLRWGPTRCWDGEDCYVVGGGPSLQAFEWARIEGLNTIGCNSAFCLGAHVVKICIFADKQWWEEIGRKGLPSYGGIVVGSANWMEDVAIDIPDWVWYIPREGRKNGLSHTGLGFNNNCGSLAINLALRLGAKRVFLLGFDMKMQGQRGNWHDLCYEPPNPTHYPFFLDRMNTVARDLPTMFPGQEVINVTDDSALDVFPKVSLKDHFERAVVRKGKVCA